MRIGTRWRAGGDPPAGLPEAFVSRLREVEAGLPPAEIGVARWTLTWLERRPKAELDLGILVALQASGEVTVEEFGDLDDDPAC